MPWGSSPRMRGALYGVGDPGVGFRIIPTDAGSTAWRSAGPARPWDHPRGCGEHIGKTYSWSHWAGSSPRMRGARSGRGPAGRPCRIIPADAGSTSPTPPNSPPVPDHPRGCGEHVSQRTLGSVSSGSSPRMRGALRPSKDQSLEPGIIPADAGSTQAVKGSEPGTRDHPRGCGEHSRWARWHSVPKGSSPRMRGAQGRHQRPCTPGRIIPADAGSTAPAPAPVRSPGDHPRGCGEHRQIRRLDDKKEGSSPRMRGARITLSRCSGTGRIIPADAGSTVYRVSCQDSGWDHPRGCGEHSTPSLGASSSAGSSPRMRGAR